MRIFVVSIFGSMSLVEEDPWEVILGKFGILFVLDNGEVDKVSAPPPL